MQVPMVMLLDQTWVLPMQSPPTTTITMLPVVFLMEIRAITRIIIQVMVNNNKKRSKQPSLSTPIVIVSIATPHNGAGQCFPKVPSGG